MDIQIRTITDDGFEEWSRAEARGFSTHASDEYVDVARTMAEVDRTFGAFDGTEIVGTATTRTSELTVPGGTVPLGYVDDVSVFPTHRRRGILTRMMRAQLDQMHERGEPFAALSASESLIYGRFGFGVATWTEQWRIERRHSTMKTPPDAGGRMKFIDPDVARSEWPCLHRLVRRDRVGMARYSDAYWRMALLDSPGQRRGASAFFHVAYLRNDSVSGLCSYRIRDHEVLVVFLLGEDPEVEAELWQYCFGIDLMTQIQGFNRPVDDPLPWRLDDVRRLNRTTTDHMWLRLIDVNAALEARQYDCPGALTLKVSDDFCDWNDGVYELKLENGGAVCTSSDGQPDLHLSVADLAAVYLGGTSFSALARAGRVMSSDMDALRLADRMFRTDRAPWYVEL